MVLELRVVDAGQRRHLRAQLVAQARELALERGALGVQQRAMLHLAPRVRRALAMGALQIAQLAARQLRQPLQLRDARLQLVQVHRVGPRAQRRDARRDLGDPGSRGVGARPRLCRQPQPQRRRVLGGHREALRRRERRAPRLGDRRDQPRQQLDPRRRELHGGRRAGDRLARTLQLRLDGGDARRVRPLAMDVATFTRFRDRGRPLNEGERGRLADLVARDPPGARCADLLRAILDAGVWIEQEAVFADAVIERLGHRRQP